METSQNTSPETPTSTPSPDASDALAEVPRPPRRRSFRFYAVSAAIHLGVLGALAGLSVPLSSDPDEGPSADQIVMIQHYLMAASEKELEEAETEQVAENTADNKEAGTGTRARGEEGSLGRASKGASGHRYGVAGPSAPSGRGDPQRASLADAAEFGMIGLLNSGAGGDPNAPVAPWGSNGAAGQSAWGSPISDSFGAGGLGLTGIGEGGGGGITTGIGSNSIRNSSPKPIAGRSAPPKGALFAAAPSVAAPPAAAPVFAAPAPETPIDPNGRFATTYRPGGGHLAAFESAVARGIVSAAEREVVSDIGARYSPSLDLTPGKALTVRADLERGALPPSGGAFHVRVALRGSPEAADARPHLSVHLVLDVSGSMAGEPLSRAREAAEALVDRLAPTDDFSLVTFSSDAQVKVPDGLVGPRRAAIREVLRGIRDEGGTNIGAGLTLAYAEANAKSIPDDAVRVVLLLSDGHATSGDTNREHLSRLALDAFQSGIQTSAFGLGTDYDGALMSSIASDGAGGYYYLRDGEQIASALSTELDRRLDPVATAVEVRVRLKPDMSLLRVYGSRRLGEAEAARVRVMEVAADRNAAARDHIKQDRQNDNEGGMRFFMPVFARDDSHAFLLKLAAPPGVGSRSIASVELKYKDRLTKRNVVEEVSVKALYAESDADSARTADASVARTVQGFAAGEALTEASRRIAAADRDGAIAILREREDILTQAATSLGEPLFRRDASRLARLREHAGSSGAMGDSLVLSMLLETAGRSHMR